MTELTGLPTKEVGLLRVIRQTAGSGMARTRDVLSAVDRAGVMGPRAAQQTLIDLIAPWRRHLPLVRGDGNWGSQEGDPPADPEYTEVGLTRYGELALAAEEGSIGPVPLGLIDGSWYRGGQHPPYDPRAVLQALQHRDAAGLLPAPPTGGRVSGNLTDLAAGRPAHVTVSATAIIERREPAPVKSPEAPPGAKGAWVIWTTPRHKLGGDRVVVTEIPYGVSIDDAVNDLLYRSRAPLGDPPVPDDRPNAGPPGRPPRGPIEEVCDHSSDRGTSVICLIQDGADREEARRWVLSTPSLSVNIDSILPAPIDRLIADWDAGDGSGLTALADLIHSDTAG